MAATAAKRAIAVKVIATFLILSVSMQMCYSSAIPIWEFLTRTEKLSHLYSTFAQLVSVQCKATAASSGLPVNQCKRNLLSYGSERLQSFTNDQLDAIDPYQRGAPELIWSSIMHDHPSSSLITTRKPLPTPPASSIVILTHQRPAAATTTQLQQFPKNPLFDADTTENKHNFAMEMDQAYEGGYEGASGAAAQPLNTYLSGPLVVRVRPDGSPVEEDKFRPLPRDDDLEAFTHALSDGAADKSRKLATIGTRKQQQQHLTSFASQKQLPLTADQTATRRHYQFVETPSFGYFYGKGQS